MIELRRKHDLGRFRRVILWKSDGDWVSSVGPKRVGPPWDPSIPTSQVQTTIGAFSGSCEKPKRMVFSPLLPFFLQTRFAKRHCKLIWWGRFRGWGLGEGFWGEGGAVFFVVFLPLAARATPMGPKVTSASRTAWQGLACKWCEQNGITFCIRKLIDSLS